jgi:Prokaryotic RING finger family 1
VECLVLGMAVMVGFFALIVALLSSTGGGKWNEAFKHVAQRFHGTLYSGGWFRTPSVWLRHGEAQARLTISTIRGSGGERCLEFTIQQREAAGRCEIFYYQTREALLPLRRGLLPVEFNWEDFRRRWQVLAEDGDATRHLLSDGVRLAIELLWRDPIPGELTISLSPGWLVVRKVWHSPRGAELEAFVERACNLCDQLNLAVAAGIEFVAGEQPQLMEEARCGVCGENLADEIVVCRRCNTPHHRECWQYGGGCATYGCGGRECVAPGVAPMAAPHWNESHAQADRPLKPR